MSYDFSICIPVYNCEKYLGAALDSVLAQVGPTFEVVVFDGASSDETAELVSRYVKEWPQIRYVRAPVRGGIDADMAACAALGTGKYLWLFSGDDVMRPGALERAQIRTKEGADLIVCKHTICDINMNFMMDYPVMKNDIILQAELSTAAEREQWFRHAATTEAFFSFMSGLIVRREVWERGRLDPTFDGSCWGHVARMFELARVNLRVQHVNEIWLDQRSGNDSFIAKGAVNRYRIAIEGYLQLADHFFGLNSLEAFHIRRVLRREFPVGMFLIAKVYCKINPAIENRQLLNHLFYSLYGANIFSDIGPLLAWHAIPAWAVPTLRRILWVFDRSARISLANPVA